MDENILNLKKEKSMMELELQQQKLNQLNQEMDTQKFHELQEQIESEKNLAR